jgi:hypothetical protein
LVAGEKIILFLKSVSESVSREILSKATIVGFDLDAALPNL